MLTLEALQANDGDCFLLHSGNGDEAVLILVDGGSAGVYRNVIKKRLNELRGGNQNLTLRLVIVSHIDADHITGIRDLFKEMSEEINDSQEPDWKIGSLWHNAFENVVRTHRASAATATIAAAVAGEVDWKDLEPKGLENEKAIAVVASVKQGKELQALAKSIKTPINKETNGRLIVAPDSGALKIKITANLTFTILGPRQVEIDALEDEWEKSKAKGGTDEKAVAADYLNRTVPNLSSIVFLAEDRSGGTTRRLLMTGDAGGDLVLKGLSAAGLLADNGSIKVDVLKIQHHGSNHSITEDFFRKVVADAYVISGDGKHGIPHMDVLGWLSRARKSETIDVYMTNRHLEDKGMNLTPGLDEFLADEKAAEPNHCYHFRGENDLSISIR